MIGCEEEIRELRRRYASEESEFVAIYERRHIGKTFLVNEVFNGNFAFLMRAWRRLGLLSPDRAMVIDCRDRMINVCEMKYTSECYSFDADEKAKLLCRIEQFRSATNTRQGILPTLVTTVGLKHNANGAMTVNVVTLDALFRP